jgi:hypothetical protein
MGKRRDLKKMPRNLKISHLMKEMLFLQKKAQKRAEISLNLKNSKKLLKILNIHSLLVQ